MFLPNKNLHFGATPYGQADIVSFVNDQVTSDFLIRNYKVLIFSGWNTCSEKQYGTLLNYVRDGGKLFISIPQLSTDVTRNIWQYTREDLVHGGDFSELCGVKVKGRGPRFYWATAPGTEKNCLGVDISRRYGVAPERSASILDSSSCIVQGILPYGAQVLAAVGLAGGTAAVSAFEVLKFLCYPYCLAFFLILAIALGGRSVRKSDGKVTEK